MNRGFKVRGGAGPNVLWPCLIMIHREIAITNSAFGSIIEAVVGGGVGMAAGVAWREDAQRFICLYRQCYGSFGVTRQRKYTLFIEHKNITCPSKLHFRRSYLSLHQH